MLKVVVKAVVERITSIIPVSQVGNAASPREQHKNESRQFDRMIASSKMKLGQNTDQDNRLSGTGSMEYGTYNMMASVNFSKHNRMDIKG